MTKKRYSIPDFKETGYIKTVEDVVGEIPVAKWLIFGVPPTGVGGYFNCEGELTDKAKPVSYKKLQEIQAKAVKRYPAPRAKRIIKTNKLPKKQQKISG